MPSGHPLSSAMGRRTLSGSHTGPWDELAFFESARHGPNGSWPGEIPDQIFVGPCEYGRWRSEKHCGLDALRAFVGGDDFPEGEISENFENAQVQSATLFFFFVSMKSWGVGHRGAILRSGEGDESLRRGAGSQWIVATRPLCHLQCPVAYLSRLQRIQPTARWEGSFEAAGHSTSAGPA